jgi:hypothetical protein
MWGVTAIEGRARASGAFLRTPAAAEIGVDMQQSGLE